MQARLYGLGISNPSQTVRLMLAFKGVDAKWVELLPGIHPLLLYALGFRRGTVPAMKLEGRRIEGSLEIAQGLEALVPEPSLYPSPRAAPGCGGGRALGRGGAAGRTAADLPLDVRT